MMKEMNAARLSGICKVKKMRDPVCGMEVGQTLFKSSHKGKEYHFCSASCKQSFDKNPGRYAK